ncbi:hypothetical protein BS78_07G120400 [Paspalum vaginatum]|nr:hypothetical protein BS78_07G120400 [Paspalum vaginatum]
MIAQRIRIFFSDPDATDSDSGDDTTSNNVCGRTEIIILHSNSVTITKKKRTAGCTSQEAIGSSALAACSNKRSVTSTSTKQYHGVYERQPGRWAAEFRSYRLKVRHWVGTFGTEEEAKAAYDDFKKQFFSSPHCVRRPVLKCGGKAGDVHRVSHPPADEKRQIVLALAATKVLTSSASAMAVPVPSAPGISSFPPAAAAEPLTPPTPFQDMQLHDDPPPSRLHSFWAEPTDEDLVGLADLANLPLPFSNGNMDFDPADLSLFDGFL